MYYHVFTILVVIFFILWNLETIFRYDLVTQYGFTDCLKVTDYGLPELIKAKDSISEVLASFIPICIMVPANIAIFIKLSLRHQAQNELGIINQNEKELVQTTLMLITITVAFIVLVTPLSIYILMFGFRFGDPILDVFVCLEGVNAACNVALYFMMGTMFRSKVVALVCSCVCLRCKPQTSSPSGSGSGSSQTKQSAVRFQSSQTGKQDS